MVYGNQPRLQNDKEKMNHLDMITILQNGKVKEKDIMSFGSMIYYITIPPYYYCSLQDLRPFHHHDLTQCNVTHKKKKHIPY